jgi:hypothetical protein
MLALETGKELPSFAASDGPIRADLLQKDRYSRR